MVNSNKKLIAGETYGTKNQGNLFNDTNKMTPSNENLKRNIIYFYHIQLNSKKKCIKNQNSCYKNVKKENVIPHLNRRNVHVAILKKIVTKMHMRARA